MTDPDAGSPTKAVLITGATGMVGSRVLEALLARPDVGRVVSIARRPGGVRHDKIREIVHGDFLDFSGLDDGLAGIDVCFHCLGVYTGRVSKEAFFEITCDVQKALTDVLAAASPEATFVLFGASGADPTEKSPILFARAKGRAERLLSETPFPRQYVFRPGYIHPTGARRPEGLNYRLFFPIAGWLMKAFPFIGVTDQALARAMVRVGMEGTEPSRIVTRAEIPKIAENADAVA